MANDHDPDPMAAPAPLPRHVAFKAGMLLALVLLVVGAAVAYLLYARGMFESTQSLRLLADDSEGVSVGMDLTYAGFPVGRVRRIELADDGKVRIVVAVARKDAGWLRTTSIFTLERGLVGDARLRAYTGVLTDPPLPPDAERTVLRGDVSAQIPQLVATLQAVANNIERMTQDGSDLNASLGSVRTLSQGFQGPYGVLGAALGGEENAKKLITAIDRTNTLLARGDALLARTDTLMGRTDALMGKADARLFGPQGLADDAQALVAQVQALLGDARGSLQRLDKVLAEAQAVGANARVATEDLGALRADVERSLRRVDALVLEVQRKWPFQRDTEIKLP